MNILHRFILKHLNARWGQLPEFQPGLNNRLFLVVSWRGKDIARFTLGNDDFGTWKEVNE